MSFMEDDLHEARLEIGRLEAELTGIRAEIAVARERLGPAGYRILEKYLSLQAAVDAAIVVRDLKQDCERFEENFHRADCFDELDKAEDALDLALAAVENHA